MLLRQIFTGILCLAVALQSLAFVSHLLLSHSHDHDIHTSINEDSHGFKIAGVDEESSCLLCDLSLGVETALSGEAKSRLHQFKSGDLASFKMGVVLGKVFSPHHSRAPPAG